MSNHRRRIVFLNRSFWPDIEATGQLLTDLCEGLSERFDVHVVCGQPNHPEKNSSFLAEGIEVRNGVTIHRLTHHQFQKRNPFGRIANLMSFFFAANEYLRQTSLQADVVVTETDPFMLPIAGARYAKRVDAKHCVYLQDIYPDVAEAVGKCRVPLLARFLRGRLRSVYSKASQIIVLGRCMRKRLTGPGWGLNRDKIEIIPNWADCDTIFPVAHNENDLRDQFAGDYSFIVMHSGNMGLTQRLDELIKAASQPNWPAEAKLLLVGNGASRNRLLECTAGLNLPAGRVQFVDYQPRNRLAESLSAADVHVVSMHENITGCLCPSKLYGIMAAGRSVIAIADPRTDLSQTVAERDLGWCVAPGNPQAIANAVAEAVTEKRRGGQLCASEHEVGFRERIARKAALEQFDRPVILNRFAQLLHGLLNEEFVEISEHDLSVDLDFDGRFDDSDSGIAILR